MGGFIRTNGKGIKMTEMADKIGVVQNVELQKKLENTFNVFDCALRWGEGIH